MKNTETTTAKATRTARAQKVTAASVDAVKADTRAAITAGMLSDLGRAPVKRVSHEYGAESATSVFDAFGRVSRDKTANYENEAREHLDSRKVGGMLTAGVHKLLNGKPVGNAQRAIVTDELCAQVREALKGEKATMDAVRTVLRAMSLA